MFLCFWICKKGRGGAKISVFYCYFLSYSQSVHSIHFIARFTSSQVFIAFVMKKKCDSFSILIKELLSVPLSSLFLLLSQMRFINVAFSYGIISSSVPWMITMFVRLDELGSEPL